MPTKPKAETPVMEPRPSEAERQEGTPTTADQSGGNSYLRVDRYTYVWYDEQGRKRSRTFRKGDDVTGVDSESMDRLRTLNAVGSKPDSGTGPQPEATAEYVSPSTAPVDPDRDLPTSEPKREEES